MGRIIHFEITADDVARAADFYRTALGWRTEPSPFAGDYLIAATGDGSGIDGAVMSRGHQSQPAILWLQADDIAATVKAVTAAGGSAAGDVHEIPGQGLVAYIRDTEGNLLGLRQPASVPALDQPSDAARS